MAEEHKKHSEHPEHKEHKEVHHKTKIKKIVIWQASALILAVLFIISLATGGFRGAAANKISAKSASEKALDFINANLLQPGMAAELKSVSEKSGVYDIKINIAGKDYDSYVTVDGGLLFPSSFDLSQKIELPATPETSQRVDVSADDDPSKGPKNAKITIIEFSDFQCPYCKKAEPVIKQVLETYGDDVRFVYRDFPLSFHQNAQKAAEAAECADEQGKFWEYHDIIFENQDALDVSNLKIYAANLKLDTAKFNDCMDSEKYVEEVKKDFEDGQKAGVSGTPAFFINGRLLSGAQPFEDFKAVIDEELGEGSKEETTNVQTAKKTETANTVAAQTVPAGSCGI